MKVSQICSLAMGVSFVMTAASASACGFSPMAADRYSDSSCREAVAVPDATPARIGNEQGEAFKPFAVNRYTMPSVVAQLAVGAVVTAGVDAGAGFKPFEVNRYSVSAPSRSTENRVSVRVTRPSIEE